MNELIDTGLGTHLRVPTRLFESGNFCLPVRTGSTIEGRSEFVLQIPASQLEDPGVSRLVASEYSGSGFEREEREFLLSRISPGNVFVDVGAHFGIYALSVACCHEQVQCLAIEPHPHNHSVLEASVRRNNLGSRISCARTALADRKGMGLLRSNTSMGHHLLRWDSTPNVGTLDVAVTTLDDLVLGMSAFSGGSFVIKIDTEGREKRVLEGARGTLSSGRVKALLWEFSVGEIENPELDDVVEFLRDFGFQSRQISDHMMFSEPV